MIIIRYADDIVVGFQYEKDARRFQDEMRERLQEFALSLHPEMTRLSSLAASRRPSEVKSGSANRQPSTFSASPSSAANFVGVSSSSSDEQDGTVCRQGCKK